MNSPNPQFPCLCVHRKLIFPVETQRELMGATADGHRTGVLQELKIIDSLGREFLMEPPPKRPLLARLWTKLSRQREPRPTLRLVRTGQVLSVHQIRQLLIIDSQRQGPVNRVRSKELKERIDAAKTPAEILQLIATQSSNTSLAQW